MERYPLFLASGYYDGTMDPAGYVYADSHVQHIHNRAYLMGMSAQVTARLSRLSKQGYLYTVIAGRYVRIANDG